MRLLDPEKTALELLARTGQSGPPVDLDRVAALWPGLKISAENLEREGYLVDLGAQGAEIIVWGRSQLRKRDQNPSIVFTWTSQKPSPSSSRAYSPRP